MKKLIFILLITTTNLTYAQTTNPLKRIYQADTIIWLGLDFTDVTLFDNPESSGFREPQKIRDYYFSEWNNMVFKESEKFDFEDFMDKDHVIIHMDELKQANTTVDMSEALTNTPSEKPLPSRTDEELHNIVNQHDFKDLTGIGAMIIVTELNKAAVLATAYLVFIDMSTKEILYTKKYQEKARGFGFRNYWLGAFYKMYDNIDIKRWYRSTKR